jgi:hypothetical protein
MESSDNGNSAPRPTPPTAKEKNVVQRAVNALLDSLAPERATTRADRLPAMIEQHRTPTGCVLQAPTAAVSLSWFPDSANDASLGELQVFVWEGIVSRRGSAQRPDGAKVTREFVLRPVERPTDESVWRAEDGTTYNVQQLSAYCLELLNEQMRVGDPDGTAPHASGKRRD